MWTIIGGILATAGRIGGDEGDKDLNIYLTDNEGILLIDNAGNFLTCGKETE